MQGLDQHITGNWGEDSVPLEFVKAEELGDMEGEVRIDVAPQIDDEPIVATITSVVITSGMVYVKTKEFAYSFVMPVGANVYFADDED